MKVKKLITAAVPVMLLFGCGVEKTDSTNTEKAAQSQTVVKKEKVSKEDYPNKINDLCVEFDEVFAEYNAVTEDFLQGKKEKEDVIAKLKELNGVVDKFLAIDPPSEYKDTQKDVEKAMNHYIKSFKLAEDSFNAKKNAKPSAKDFMDKATVELEEGDKYWKKFNKALEDKVTFGDGTITIKDLKELDKKAGIDVDAIEKHLSKDGKELIGIWGFNDPSGFMVSLILKEDKTFETYGKGEYPDKKNLLTGKWEYIPNTHTFVLHIEKMFEESVEVQDAQRSVRYQIQNFDGENIQLFNAGTFNTIKYVKQN